MNDGSASRSLQTLERARQISLALSGVARLARFSTKAKGGYAAGGFGNRQGAAAFRFVVLGSLLLCVVVPSIVTAIYYAFVASDQYVSAARFAVSTGQPVQMDGVGNVTGLASAAIVRDTQIVTNYIASRAAVEKIETRVPLRQLYANPDVDYLSRFDPKQPIEKFVRYWEDKARTTITMPAGIVELTVRAFTPEDAKTIAQTVVEVSEELINDQNEKIKNDALAIATEELRRATLRLTSARIALEKARNEVGYLDIGKANEALNQLVTETRGKLITLQQEYATQSKLVSTTAPQMRVLKERIDALSAQITAMEQRATRQAPGGDAALSASMTQFSQLELERQIAERLYAGAAANVEVARLLSEQKQMYINTFVSPALPEEPRYPHRVLYPFLFSLALAGGWGIVVGLSVLVRNHMA